MSWGSMDLSQLSAQKIGNRLQEIVFPSWVMKGSLFASIEDSQSYSFPKGMVSHVTNRPSMV